MKKHGGSKTTPPRPVSSRKAVLPTKPAKAAVETAKAGAAPAAAAPVLHPVPAEPVKDGQGGNGAVLTETIKSQSGLDLTEKIKELVRLAQEQGYLTYSDINDALPDSVVTPEDLDEIYIKLRNLEVEIVDQAEVDRVKQPEPEEEEDKSRLDILDDPVRMYLKQMGQVPLLTREQEVEISKRIEDAENEVKRIIYSFWFAGKEHIALAEKLISEPPKERFDRVIVDKKIEGRENHLKVLRKLVKDVRTADQVVDGKYAAWQTAANKTKQSRAQTEFKKTDDKLQKYFSRFYYKQKVIEEMALVAENIYDKFQASLRTIREVEHLRKSPHHQTIVQSEQRKNKALEEFVRMPYEDFLKAYQQLQLFTKKALQA
ncbi:MAG: RNA polymerase subunit sigma, partial [Pedosphaera parvula]|nr:RNA polymerase subunit sigma [Pedosphaera parvula]